ncbi:hypothetical protein Tco_0054141, partial [Tanacetum coccineum]
EITSLKRRVKKLEKKDRSRTHKLKRLYKVGLTARVESSGDEEDLGEDASNQERRINDIDADEDITLVNVQDDVDNEMFDVNVLNGKVVFVARQNENVVKEAVDAAQVSTAATTVTITTKEITLAQALEALKTSKPKDKGKGIMIEEPVKPMKKKDQISFDEETAKKFQAQEQEELSDAEKATLFQQLLEKRRKHFAAKRAEEKRNKPPTKAQQRQIMWTYLKNMEGYKLKDLKQSWWKKKTRAGEELIQESLKKKKVDDDKETTELKHYLEIIQDEEEVAIDVIPLAVKCPRIVDWKIHKEGKKSYYQIVRADEKSQMHMIFSQILKSFNREDLEDLYKLIYMLVEKKYPLTPPTLSMMLEKKLQIDYESEMAYQLSKLIINSLRSKEVFGSILLVKLERRQNLSSDDEKKVDVDLRKDSECNDQENEDNVNSTNNVMQLWHKRGFEDPDFLDRVYMVEKAMYGLHRAPRAWHKGEFSWDQVYVDDIIFDSTKKELCFTFENQDKYVDEILKKFGFTEVKTTSTPMEIQKHLIKDEDGEEVDVYMYRSMIGSLMYLISSRPDIMFAVCAYARYQVNPKVSHLHTVNRIFSDYARASLDKKSTTGGCQFLGYRLISWQCKKHAVVANSTKKAEYVAASSCCGQVLWIQNQLLDYGMITTAGSKPALEGVQQLQLIPITHPPLFNHQLNLKRHKKPRKPKRKDTQVPQPSDPSENVADEAVHKELGDSLVRAATTASSLEAEQDSGNITKTRSKATPNESSSLGTTLGCGPRAKKHKGYYLLRRFLIGEETKTTHQNEIDSLKRRVKKLEKKRSSRTYKLKRLYKVGLSTRVESYGDEESLGEDASKQGRRINAIDAEEDITLVNVQDDTDNEMFDVDALNGKEVFVVGQNKNVVEEVVNAAQDKGKGIMIEEPVKPMKKKVQIMLDEEVSSKLQAEFDEEERLAREKDEKEKEANIALIET